MAGDVLGSWVPVPSSARERVPDRGLLSNGDTLHLCYGAANTIVCVAETSLATLDHLEQHPFKPGSAGGPLMGTIGPP